MTIEGLGKKFQEARLARNLTLDEAARMQIALPGLALARQLYVALQAQGHGRDGTQALILALEAMSPSSEEH